MYFVENSGVLRAIRALLKPREIFTTVERPPRGEFRNLFQRETKGLRRQTISRNDSLFNPVSGWTRIETYSPQLLEKYFARKYFGYNFSDASFLFRAFSPRRTQKFVDSLRTKFKLGRFSKNPIVGYFLKIIKFARKILLYAFR